MASMKTAAPSGKKQACVPGPKSAAYKKVLAAKKGIAGKTRRLGTKAGSAYASVKSRQMLVERMKREIWAAVLEINQAIIGLAELGNFQAAKALFDFAGVYSLPEPVEKETTVAAEPQTAQSKPVDPVDAFFRSIGVPAPACESEMNVGDEER